jgi:5-methylcytosine-specific restriction protein A
MPWSKESRQSRGYGADWEKVRLVVIERAKGLCEKCAAEGKVAQGRDVDHIVSKAKAKAMRWSKAKTDHPSNLQYLCGPCHKRKSAEEEGRTYNEPRPRIGLDGYPVE